jgi:hypothetical protein
VVGKIKDEAVLGYDGVDKVLVWAYRRHYSRWPRLSRDVAGKPRKGEEREMAENTDANADNLVGVPEPQPPKGGPEADPNTPNPADVTPGLGGTSAGRPRSETEDENR